MFPLMLGLRPRHHIGKHVEAVEAERQHMVCLVGSLERRVGVDDRALNAILLTTRYTGVCMPISQLPGGDDH